MAWDKSEHEAVAKALAIVCDATGTQWSAGTMRFILGKLEGYRAAAVLLAIEKCAETCRFRLTLADVIGHLRSAPLPEVTRRKALPERSGDGAKRLSEILSTVFKA